ncbi:MAG: aldehyde dehydrogenase EutE [Fuerstiella sp.]|nr:aldehyde dehydrogenase EutE [Fuerstiella sp.]
MHATEHAIRQVVQEVLSQLSHTGGANGSTELRQNGVSVGNQGVFDDVDSAVTAAQRAFEQLSESSIETRRVAIDIVKRICEEQADELGRLEIEETKIGRLDHKVAKLKLVRSIPGVEFLRSDVASGDHGLTVTEYAPFGVIGAITPVTHSLPTIAGNFVNMVAAGNTLVVNPHPSGAGIASEGVRRFNQAIYEATGLQNLITIIRTPTVESAQAIFDHRGVRVAVVTGGPAVARAALKSPKRAIVAGPGNPPVVVDETADVDNAARSIVTGAAFDNNLLCIAEKEVFAVGSIFEELMASVSRHGGYQLNAQQTAQLTSLAFASPKEPGGSPLLNRDFIGKDPLWLAGQIGVTVPPETEILFGETDEHNPFVPVEQMMPFVPFVRVNNVDTAIAMAKKYEHGFGHTAIIHSNNVKTITKMGRIMNTTLYVKNGPCTAGLGIGGEGYPSFSIATPTGEGVTNPMTFTRQRRCADGLRIV